MDDLHEIESVATLCIIRWLSVQYNNKKTTFWVFIRETRSQRLTLVIIG